MNLSDIFLIVDRLYHLISRLVGADTSSSTARAVTVGYDDLKSRLLIEFAAWITMAVAKHCPVEDGVDLGFSFDGLPIDL